MRDKSVQNSEQRKMSRATASKLQRGTSSSRRGGDRNCSETNSMGGTISTSAASSGVSTVMTSRPLDADEGYVLSADRAEACKLKEHCNKMINHGERANDTTALLRRTTILTLTTATLRRALIKQMAGDVLTLYCTLELADTTRLLKKHNSDPEKRGIDLVIVELDRSMETSAVRLMEMLQRRSEDPVLRLTPLIPVLLLLHSDINVTDTLERCLGFGLAGFLEENAHGKEVFMFLLGDVVRRYASLHESVQAVRQLRVFKYPKFEMIELDGEQQPVDHKDDDHSTASGESWSVASDLMDKGNETSIYKKHNFEDLGEYKRKKPRGSRYLSEVIRTRVMPMLQFLHRIEITDPQARPKLLRTEAENAAKGVVLPEKSNLAAAQITPEAEPFVKIERPEDESAKTCRGILVGRLAATTEWFEDPWADHAAATNRASLRRPSSPTGDCSGPAAEEDAPMRTSYEMAVMENRLAERMPSPAKQNFPALVPAESAVKLNELASAAGQDLLQYDLLVPEPLLVRSNPVNRFILRGFNYHLKGDLARALEFYQFAVQKQPCTPAYFYRAITHDAKGDYVKALADLNEAIACNAKKPELDQQILLYNRAVVASKLGMDHYALADLHKAMLQDKDEVIFLTNRAMIHRRHGQYYAACEHYKRLMVLKEAAMAGENPPPDIDAHIRRMTRTFELTRRTSSTLSGTSPEMRATTSMGVTGFGMTFLAGVTGMLVSGHATATTDPRRPSSAPADRYMRLSGAATTCDRVDAFVAGVTPSPGVNNSSSSAARLFVSGHGGPSGNGGGPSSARAEHDRRLLSEASATCAGVDAFVAGVNPSPRPCQTPSPRPSPRPCTSPRPSPRRMTPHVTVQEPTTQRQQTAMSTLTTTGRKRRPSTAVVRRRTRVQREEAPAVKSWKSHRLEFTGEKLHRITEPGPVGPLHAWTEQTAWPKEEDFGDDEVAAMEWQAVIQNQSTVFEGIFCKPSELQTALAVPPGGRQAAHLDVIVPTLEMFPFLSGLDKEVIRDLASVIEYRLVPDGKQVCIHGHIADACFLILRGSVNVQVHNVEDTVMTLYTLGQYESFGELALVDAERPTHLESYIAEQNSELLMVLQEDFNRLLHRHAFNHLKARCLMLKKLRLFTGWSDRDLTRLARMSEHKIYPRNKVILRQTEQPSCLHVLMKGAIIVRKTPSRTAELQQQKLDIEKQLTRIRTKYAYHHTIRIKSRPDLPKHLQGLTSTEIRKRELTAELGKVEAALRVLTKSSASAEPASPTAKSTSIAETASPHAHIDYQVRTLTPPALFGEEAILDPHGGMSLGTFESDTRVEVMLLHKVVFQTFDIADSFLSRLQLKATVYPSNLTIIAEHEKMKHWERYKEELMSETPKRWRAKDFDSILSRFTLT